MTPSSCRFLPTRVSCAALGTVLLLLGARADAQEPVVAGHAIYFETMGPTLVALNFDSHLTRHITARVGAGRLKYDTSFLGTEIEEAWVVPITLSFLAGRGPSHFETCLGAVVGDGEPGGTLGLGYRYQNPGTSGLLIRAGVSLIVFDGGVAGNYSFSIGRSW